ncbi:hypothetical protein [Bradyrhizobium sp. CSS354]|uniref:hypothetical protein n=1 Tax=Bradyrhizobium sp. CSS354 TaxID=2699172 RepID=UPI0023B1EC98|nr:hypothetical protein [Bradyrhizobium sp. CSS354]MDE5460320.1 hypothetical protein [Bradyrhizobium sp. CSS354]
MPDAHKLGGIANLSVGNSDEIDTYVDLVEASTVQAFLEELNAGRVQFTNIDIDRRPASHVGAIDDTDRLRVFVDGRPTLRVAVPPL